MEMEMEMRKWKYENGNVSQNEKMKVGNGMEMRKWKYENGNGNQDEVMKSWEWKRKCIPTKHTHRIISHNLEMFSQQPESAKP